MNFQILLRSENNKTSSPTIYILTQKMFLSEVVLEVVVFVVIVIADTAFFTQKALPVLFFEVLIEDVSVVICHVTKFAFFWCFFLVFFFFFVESKKSVLVGVGVGWGFVF